MVINLLTGGSHSLTGEENDPLGHICICLLTSSCNGFLGDEIEALLLPCPFTSRYIIQTFESTEAGKHLQNSLKDDSARHSGYEEGEESVNIASAAPSQTMTLSFLRFLSGGKKELSCPEQWESVPYSLKMDKKMLVLWFTWAMVPPVSSYGSPPPIVYICWNKGWTNFISDPILLPLGMESYRVGLPMVV
ncbi:hypothetical protein SAY86_013240 [Trapa natans]|uniref:Uncharacterized protein n=1 Tax=Trapa natans TaxID=22666 RepID=A0AAN7MFG4_TRANT|nr:hypothetical protein SAY86_013240 [Trapa natans]